MAAKNMDHLGSNLGGSQSGFELVKGAQAKTMSNEKTPAQEGTDHGTQAQNTNHLTQNPVFPLEKKG